MENSTHVSYFILSLYSDTGLLKYVWFMVVLILYILILFSNILIIFVICVNRGLHEPMYLFLCSLLVNELYGSVSLFPFLLVQILSDIHTISTSFCFLQIFMLYSYACAEICNLTAMSYDRYLAICCPLHYKNRMSSTKTALLIALTWIYTLLTVIVLMSLTSTLTLCGNTVHKVYCDNYSIVKLACSDTTGNNLYGLIYTVILVVVGAMILYSYGRILKVCAAGSKQTRRKALRTCAPHLVAMVNFSFGCFFEIVQGRLHANHISVILRIFLSLYVLICPPLLNPVLYGFTLTKVRVICKSLLFAKM